MADDNKIVITIDADTEQMKVKIGQAESMLKGFGESGGSAFEGLGMKALGLNAALELGQKALELYHEGLDAIEKSEAFNNQRLALNNFGGMLGLTKTQVDALLKAIQQATHETVTGAQAQTAAWKLLQAGFTAETIPSIVEFAHRMAETRPEVGGFDAAIQKLSFSLESGTTRGLKQLGIEMQATGDRTTIATTILKQAEAQMLATGEGYQTFGERMKAKSSDWTEHFKRTVGGLMEDVGVKLFGTDLEKNIHNLDILQNSLKNIDAEIAKGQTTTWVFNETKSMTEQVDIMKAKKDLLDKISAAQGKITDGVKEEKTAQAELTAEIGKQTKEKPTIIDPTTATNIKVANNKKMYEEMLANETEYSNRSDAIVKGLENAKRQQIELTFQNEMRKLQEAPMTKQQFAAREIALERQKFEALQQIKRTDLEMQEAELNAELAYYAKNNSQIMGLEDKKIKSEMDLENKMHQHRMKLLQSSGMQKAQFDQKMEQLETQHQKKMQTIIESHNKLTVANVKSGWLTGMGQMKNEWGSWAKTTQKMAVQSQHVMSASITKMAKDHKFAMDEMLNSFLGMIGETLIQKGTADILMGIYPPNPAALGAGAAEIALGAALVGISGGGGGGDAPSMGGAIGSDIGNQQNLTAPAASDVNKKSAQIIINGDLLNSQETVNHIQELIRKNSDVTDYTITAQGKQYGT